MTQQGATYIDSHQGGPARPDGLLPVEAASSAQSTAWSAHARAIIVTFVALVIGLIAFVGILNPYGNLPVSLFGSHTVMDINQRFQYPALIREARFDSFVLGTSTSRLLEPRRLDERFGGTFINLGINSGRAWEQVQLGQLALKHVPQPKTIIIGLDTVWCEDDADQNRITKRGFPEWMFDEDPWNDIPDMLNTRTVEIAGRKLFYHLGLIPARIPSDGYEEFLPPDEDYKPKKARAKIWGNRDRSSLAPREPYSPLEAELKQWRYPALIWLDKFLAAVPDQSNVILAWMPVHRAAQPPPGSVQEARERECKARTAAISVQHGAHDVDFRIDSDITRRDENYWDRLHYRLPIAAVITDGLLEAVTTQRDSPKGLWVYSAGPTSPQR